MSVCLSVCLCVCLCLSVYVCLFVCLSVRLTECLSVYHILCSLYVSLSVSPLLCVHYIHVGNISLCVGVFYYQILYALWPHKCLLLTGSACVVVHRIRVFGYSNKKARCQRTLRPLGREYKRNEVRRKQYYYAVREWTDDGSRRRD